MTFTHSASPRLQQLGALCRADVAIIGDWFKEGSKGSIRLCALTIIICGGLYGFTLGYWRAAEMGLYVAVKVPLLMFLVLLSNGLINGMFASLLGSGLTFRQTLTMSLISFTTVTLILGALSPITFFMVLNAPVPGTPGAESWHSLTLVVHTALIAYAGVVGNFKAYLLLRGITKDPSTAKRTFLAWLIVNLFVGAQLSYNLRPFFGNPALDVAFLRDNAFDGSFYEVLIHHFTALF